MKNQYKTVAEIAEIFGVSKQAVWKWLEKWKTEGLKTKIRREIGEPPRTVVLLSEVRRFRKLGTKNS